MVTESRIRIERIDGLHRKRRSSREPRNLAGLRRSLLGGGKAQLVPGDKINLHFTGDLHAITSAHNLLAALVDNQLHFGSAHGLDGRRVTWGRAVDMNDRALRKIVIGLGGEGVPRETRF